MKLDEINKVEDLKGSETQRVTFLFGYRERLFSTIEKGNQALANEVFAKRFEIASIFRDFGGDFLTDFAKQLEDLEEQKGLLEVLEKKKRARETQPFKWLVSSDLENMEEDERVNALFIYKKSLLKAIKKGIETEQSIFERREEIADLFKKFGGERFAIFSWEMKILNNQKEVIMCLATKAKTREEKYCFSGFYVLGKNLPHKKEKLIRMQNKTGKPAGYQEVITELELIRGMTNFFHIDDELPIYIDGELSTKWCQKIDAIIALKPELKDRFHFLSFTDHNVKITKYKQPKIHDIQKINVDIVPIKDTNDKAVKEALNIINRIPQIGELYMGTITEINGNYIIVDILPGIDGFLWYENIPNNMTNDGCPVRNCYQDLTLEVGDEIPVCVIEGGKQFYRENPHSICPRVSMLEVEEMLKNGNNPVIGNVEMTKLLESK